MLYTWNLYNRVYQLHLNKNFSKSLVTREMQIKTTMRYLFISTSMTRIKMMNDKYVGEDVEKLKPLFIIGRNVKWYSHIRKWFGIFLQI